MEVSRSCGEEEGEGEEGEGGEERGLGGGVRGAGCGVGGGFVGSERCRLGRYHVGNEGRVVLAGGSRPHLK